MTENSDLEINLRLLRIKFIFIQLKDLQIGQRRQFRQIRELEGDWRAMTDPAIRVVIDQKRESLETGIELERRISEDLVTITTASGGQLHFRQRDGGDNTMDSLLNDMADAVYRITHGGQAPPPPGCSPQELKAEAIKLILVPVPIESLAEETRSCAVCLETMSEAGQDTEAEQLICHSVTSTLVATDALLNGYKTISPARFVDASIVRKLLVLLAEFEIHMA
jgi:hypothetical protein